MDHNDLLSISEMAKLRRVTTETLRHYDRIGLFKPIYTNPETGYRFYSFMQFETLGTIKELTQMGMKLEEIKEYMSHRNLEESINVMEKQHALLLREIQEKESLEKVITDKINFLHSLKNNTLLDKVFLRHFPERYLISEGKSGMSLKQMCVEITRLEGFLSEVAPVFATNRVGAFCYSPITSIQAEDKSFDYAPFLECSKKYKKHPLFKIIPESDYVCVRYNGRFGRHAEAFELVKDFMAKNHLEQNGYFYTNYELDITLTDNHDDTILLLQVPVKTIGGN